MHLLQKTKNKNDGAKCLLPTRTFSQMLMVTVCMSKLDYISVIFVDQGVTVDGTYH